MKAAVYTGLALLLGVSAFTTGVWIYLLWRLVS